MRAFLLLVGLVVTLVPALADPPAGVRIAGATSYPAHSLVRLKAEGVDAKAGILWRVYPSANVQRATNPRGVLEFAAPPGSYFYCNPFYPSGSPCRGGKSPVPLYQA